MKNEIEGRFVVVDDGGREPIIKSWPALWWLVGPIAVVFVIRYAQIKGWL